MNRMKLFIPPGKDVQSTKAYVRAFTVAGELGKALAVCQQWNANGVFLGNDRAMEGT